MDDITYLAHHGIKGQKWGERRYQNPDGTLTEEGKRRYGRKLKTLEDKRDIYRGREKQAKRFAKPSGVAAGVLGGASAANMVFNTSLKGGVSLALTKAGYTAIQYSSIASGAGLGLAVGGAVYGSYKGIQAVNHFIANRYDKKISEIKKKIG